MLSCRGNDPVARLGQFRIGAAGDHEIDGLSPPSPERGGLGGIAAHAGDRREALVDLVHNLLRGLVALLPGLKKHDDTAVVEILRRGKTARRAADGAADGTIGSTIFTSDEKTTEL